MIIKFNEIELDTELDTFLTFSDFDYWLSKNNVDLKKLTKKQKKAIDLIHKSIDSYMITNLRRFNMNFPQYKEYAALYMDKYKEKIGVKIQHFEKQILIKGDDIKFENDTIEEEQGE